MAVPMGETLYYDPGIDVLFCGWHTRLPQWNYDNLSAPYWRLYWNRNAGATILLNGREWELGPSKFVLIPANTPFATRLDNPVGHLYLHFVARVPYDSVKPAIITFPTSIWRPTIRELSRLLEFEHDATLRISMLARTLIQYALTQVPANALTRRPLDPRIAAAIEWMDQHSPQVLSNTQLARSAHMAVNAFIRLFHNTVGQSPQAFGRSRRIDKACLMLNFSDAGIKEIAQATGFCDRYHFSRAFRELRGIGPAAYRKRMQASLYPANPPQRYSP